MKKKVTTLIVTLVLATVVLVSSQESCFAASRYWNITKTPGSTGVSTAVTIPFYSGDITYNLETLIANGTVVYN